MKGLPVRRDDLSGPVRARLERLPAPYQAHYGVVPLPPPEEPVHLSAALPRLREASNAIAKVNALAEELKDPFILSRVLPRREAVSSSAIEGTNSTLDELLTIEEGDDAATEAAAQVRDYATVLEALLPRAREQGNSIFTVELIEDLHRAVMKGDSAYQDRPGAFRTVVVWIGGRGDIANSTYNSTPPSRIRETIEEQVRYLKGEDLQVVNQHLVTRMAIAHAHFEAVHPFRDGNGRVGRLLLPLMMAAEGQIPLYLSPYIEVHKADYYAALKAAQQRLDWDTCVGFVADAVVATTSELLGTRDALRKLSAIWQERGRFRKNSAAGNALPLLAHYPVVTITRLAKLLRVSFPAARSAIHKLTSLHILTERTGYQRNRVFASPEALAIINRPFGTPPVVPGETL
jgi:cell filamentation protein, protein adenylyltransferase